MPTIGQVQGNPRFESLAKAIHDYQEALQNPNLTAEEKAAREADLKTLQERFNALTQGIDQAERDQLGDQIRRELDDAERHDVRTGKFVWDTEGHSYSPTVHMMAGQLSLVCPIPEKAIHSPLGRAVHIPSSDPAIKSLQVANDMVMIARARCRKGMNLLPQTNALWQQAVAGVQKASILDGLTGLGSEWEPTHMSADMIELIYIQPTVAALINRFPMTSQTMLIPRLTARPTAYRAAGATASSDYGQPGTDVSNIATGQVQFIADKLMVIVGYNDEVVEDSIIAIAPELRKEVALALAIGIENAIINGSTSLADLDNAAVAKLWTTTRDVRSAWDGLRKDAQVTTSAVHDAGGTGNFNSADLLVIKRTMGIYGVANQNSNLVWIMGVDSESMCMGLTEMVTLYQYGPEHSFITGEVGKMWGIPAVTSGAIYGPNQGTVGLNASGVYDGITQTTSSLLLLNRAGYRLGDRREVTLEEDRSPQAGMNMLVASWRGNFQKVYASTQKACGVVYNMVP